MSENRGWVWLIWSLMLLAALYTQCATTKIVFADDWPKWNEKSQLLLMKALVAENGFRDREESACIAHVIVKNWKGGSIASTIKSYCSLWKSYSANYYRPRSSRIRAATPEKAPRGYEKKWPEMKEFVGQFAARQIADPCLEARHWGSEQDVKRRKIAKERIVRVFGKRLKTYMLR